jgi:hypothetical protein
VRKRMGNGSLTLTKYRNICHYFKMTEFTPVPDNTPAHSNVKLPNRRVLIGIFASLVLIALLFIFNSWQANERLKANIANIEQLIQKDDFSGAQTALTAAEVDNEFNPDLINLKDQIKKFKDSKTSFEQGNSSFIKEDFQSAITEYKKVIEKDTIRFSTAQAKLQQAQSAYSAQALKEVLSLKSKKNYTHAIAVINRAGAYLTVGPELKALKVELEPLALAEVKRAEERQLAVYRNALKKMRVETDKFNGTKFYTDRSTPYYANYSTFHLYIGKSEGGDPYLRLKVRYSDDDWLFVESASINVDGDVRDLDVGRDWDRDNGSGDIWEWVDVNATESHLSLVRDIIDSKSAVIRYFGDKYRDDRVITGAQKRALQNVLDAYEALKRL